MNRVARIGAFVQGLFAAVASAADTTPAATVPVTGFSTLFQVVVGLGLVLAAIAVAAWLARRYLPGTGVSAGPVRIVGGVMVGPRERVVILEIDDTWIVAGVTATHVQALHTLPRPADAATYRSTPPRADELLSRWLSRGRTDGKTASG